MEPQTTEILTDLQIKLKMISLIVCGSISLIFCLTSLFRAIYLHKNVARKDRVLSPIQVFTIGVFLSVLFMFIPIYYNDYNFKDTYSYIRPLLVSIHNSFRIFIIDCDFDVIVKTITDVDSTLLRICYSLYAAVLYVLAPLLTFGNVLSLFRYIKDRIRYKLCKNKKFYILSELNERSILLAKNFKGQKNSVIVFTDVYDHNDEVNYDLFTKAKELRAICLKESITHIDFISKKGDVEIFLIGVNESENVSHAVKLTTELNKKNKKKNVKIFVFSSKQSSSNIIDSIKYENLLECSSSSLDRQSCFKLRRIDELRQLIWNTIPNMNLYGLADKNNKTLSVLIVGFGGLGMEFFKMILWFFQFEGYKLQINIIDKQKDYVEKKINKLSDEFLKEKCKRTGEDEDYDIKVFSGIDATTSDLTDLLIHNGNNSERLKSTNLAFVSLGDDDINIEVSVHLRSLFDRVYGVIANDKIGWNDEVVDIYSVVYDDETANILYNDNAAGSQSCLLTNHKNVPYHIHFVGSSSSRLNYENIYNSDLENAAYRHHISWVKIESLTDEEASKYRNEYDRFEYFRLSSMAKELYQREIAKNPVLKAETTCLIKGDIQTCECANCVRRKRSEHKRWLAYTRLLGFSYKDGIRSDRALLHDNLHDWEGLTKNDKKKD